MSPCMYCMRHADEFGAAHALGGAQKNDIDTGLHARLSSWSPEWLYETVEACMLSRGSDMNDCSLTPHDLVQ